MISEKQIYNLTPEEILKKFDASPEGITDEEAEKRLRIYVTAAIYKSRNIWSYFISCTKRTHCSIR